MNAYLFGRHEGELPLHLLEGGEEGNRIRALAQLEGPEHTIFAAIELPDGASASQHVESLTTSGVDPGPLTLQCGSESCWDLLMKIMSRVADPIGWEIYLYLRLIVTGRVEIYASLVEELGPEAVRAVTDGNGVVIMEVAANNRDELEQIEKRVAAEPYVVESTAHYGVSKHHAK